MNQAIKGFVRKRKKWIKLSKGLQHLFFLGFSRIQYDMFRIGGFTMSRIERYFCWFGVNISLLGNLTAYLCQNSCLPHQSSESYTRSWCKTLPQNNLQFFDLSNSSCFSCGLTHISFKNLQNLKRDTLKWIVNACKR